MLEGIFPLGIGLDGIIGFAVILIGSIAFGWLVHRILRRLQAKAVSGTKTVLDEYLLGALANPAFIASMVLGIYLGLLYLPLAPFVDQELLRWLYVALVGIGVLSIIAGIDALLRWFGREMAPGAKTALDKKLVPVARLIVRMAGVFLGGLLILSMIGVQNEGVNGWLAEHGSRILIIIALTMLASFGLSRGLPTAIRKTVHRGLVGHPQDEVSKRSDTLATVLVTSCQVMVLGVGSLMLLNELLPGRIGPLLAGVGVAGLAIGFGAQSLVKDVINGLFIIMEGQYCVGDVAKVADISGLVIDINLRRTVLRDLDGIVHFVPNGEIRAASNFTKGFSAVNINVAVSYSTNLDHAIGAINSVGLAIAEDPKYRDSILKAPQVLRVDKLADSGIEIKVTGETRPMKQGEIMGELRKRRVEAFAREGIEIPWPHLKMYFGNSPVKQSQATSRKGAT
ncbi:MAG: mechanosensitive ion channel [Chloroflexi bacterium]|nr:mechanosensitive ion channel [Chloroflexota bacterium]